METESAPAPISSREGLSDIGRSTKKSDSINNDDKHSSGIPNWKERIDLSIAKSRKTRGFNSVQICTVDYETMEPRCRTVVSRGFLGAVPRLAVKEVLLDGGTMDDLDETDGRDEDGNNYDCVMKMTTDARSNKVMELEMFHGMKNGTKNANNVEMVWWFSKSSEQYRIRGRLQLIGSDGPLYSYADVEDRERNTNYFLTERKQQWEDLSDMEREYFYWAKAGTPFSSICEERRGVPPGGRDDDGKVLPPPDLFLMMLLYPTKIDYLRLGDNYRQTDEWDWGDAGTGCQWKSMRVNP